MAQLRDVHVRVKIDAPRYYTFRSTTEKLAEHLTHIAESGDTVIAPTHTGGRDWVIVCVQGALGESSDVVDR